MKIIVSKFEMLWFRFPKALISRSNDFNNMPSFEMLQVSLGENKAFLSMPKSERRNNIMHRYSETMNLTTFGKEFPYDTVVPRSKIYCKILYWPFR